MVVWMVAGPESWSEVNEMCMDVLQCGEIDKKILAGDKIEVYTTFFEKLPFCEFS